MMKKIIQLIMIVFIASQGVMAQSVSIANVVEPPGEILVPIDLQGFDANTSIGALTLYIDYDTDLMEYTGIADTTIPGFIVNDVSGQIRIIYTNWGANLSNGKLLDLVFNYNGGFSSNFTFDESRCEVTYVGLITVDPTYTNGSITQDGSLGTVSMGEAILEYEILENYSGFPVTIPVTMEGTGYGAVNAMTLKIQFNTDELDYVGLANNTYGFLDGTPDENGELTLIWEGDIPVDFTALMTLFNMQFRYLGVGNTEVDFIPGCEITSGLTPLATTYENGTIPPFDSPYGLIIENVGAETDSSAVTVPIVAAGFDGVTPVGAITLEISYNDSLIFTGFDSFQGSGWVLNGNSNNVLSIGMTVGNGFDLEDGNLLTLDFMYDNAGGGVVDINFISGCEMAAQSSPLWLVPLTFENGTVASLSTTFTVVDGDDNPITDAVVTFDGVEYPAGTYTFSGLADGTYEYTIVRDGYLTVTGTADVTGGSVTINVVMQAVFTVSGILKYDNTAGTPMTNSTVKLMSSDGLTEIASTPTDGSGNYSFTDVLSGDYMLMASTAKAWGGFNGLDLLALRNHLLGTSTLTGLKWYAADVNNTNTVNGLDLLGMRNRLISGTLWNRPDWIFEPISVSVSSNQFGINILGICTGDANASYTP